MEKKYIMRRKYNKSYINRDYLLTTLKYLLELQNKYNHNNPRLNETIYHLHHMLFELTTDSKGNDYTTFDDKDGGHNKTYNSLRERYIHISYKDPCTLKREIRSIVLSATDTVEVDITATAVYIYAKYITKDDDLLRCYKESDFYSVLNNISRDEQKKLAQIWLQGQYNNNIEYNHLFPITAKYLKQTSDEYKKNSGLFRDKEVRLLDDIRKDVQLLFHLHDGFYTVKRNKQKLISSIKKHYGENIKYKIKDYSEIKYTEQDIKDIINNIVWKYNKMTPQQDNHFHDNQIQLNSVEYNPESKYKYVYVNHLTGEKEELNAYNVQRLYSIQLKNIVDNNLLLGIMTNPMYII